MGLRVQGVFFLRTTVEKELPGDGEFGLDVAGGQETVVADPDEPRREDVESEAAKNSRASRVRSFFFCPSA